MNKTLLATALSAGMAFSGAANAIILIDDFSPPDHTARDTSVNPGAGTCAIGGGATSGTGCFSSALNASILGGERDLYADLVTRTSAANDVELKVAASTLSFNVGSGAQGVGEVTWDGIDGSAAVDTTGLNIAPGVGFDLTGGGLFDSFVFDVIFSDAGFDYQIKVWDELGVGTTGDFVAAGTDVSMQTVIGFDDAEFSGFDFTSIGALQIVIDPNAGFTSLDLTIDGIRAASVSEPGILGLMSLGLFGAMYAGRKKLK